MMRTVRVTVTGLVQGVGYRAWVADEATQRGLSGWVRNRRDGSVEAMLSGDFETVEAMIGACRAGPPAAVVDNVMVVASGRIAWPSGFRIEPTA